MSDSSMASAKDYEIPRKIQSQEFPELSYSVVTKNSFAKITQDPANSKPKASSSKNPFQTYLDKPNPEEILMTQFLESPEIPQLRTFVANIFKPASLWVTPDPQKTQNFYELILVDTQSIDIQQVKNKNDSNRIDYSKLYIKRILKASQFQDIHTTVAFSVNFIPPHFNYIDYMEAWFRTLYIRSFDHSWFINFHQSFNKDIPFWFYDWWMKIGPVPSIYPEQILQGFNLFSKIDTSKPFQKTLLFHSTFRVPWIFAWSFQIEVIHTDMPCSLIRRFKTKWWQNYKTEFCNKEAVNHYFKTGQKLQIHTNIQSLTDKAQEKIIQKPSVLTIAAGVPIQAITLPTVKKEEDQPEDFDKIMAFYQHYKAQKKKVIKIEDSSQDPFGGPFGQDPFDY